MRDSRQVVDVVDFVRAALLIPLIAVGLAAPVPQAAAAADRDVELSFIPPAGDVDGYRFYILDESAQIEDVEDVGFVAPGGDGIARIFFALDEAVSYQAAMTAYNANGESARSNSILIDAVVVDPCPSGDCGGTPPPPPSSPIAIDDMGLVVLSEGTHTLTITGEGFTRRPKIRFQNGVGRKPKVKKVTWIDENTCEVMLKVRHDRRLNAPSNWDMQVKVKGLGEIVVPGAIWVVPPS